jgi:hypothetical protein
MQAKVAGLRRDEVQDGAVTMASNAPETCCDSFKARSRSTSISHAFFVDVCSAGSASTLLTPGGRCGRDCDEG